jgi:hypothetical protein
LVGAEEPLVRLALVKTAALHLIQLRPHHLVGVVGLTEDLQLLVQQRQALLQPVLGVMETEGLEAGPPQLQQ